MYPLVEGVVTRMSADSSRSSSTNESPEGHSVSAFVMVFKLAVKTTEIRRC